MQCVLAGHLFSSCNMSFFPFFKRSTLLKSTAARVNSLASAATLWIRLLVPVWKQGFNIGLFAPRTSAQCECNSLLYLAHTLHAPCHHDAGVSRQYGLSSQTHGLQARPADHLAAPGGHRVWDSCSHTGLPDRVLASTCGNRQHFCLLKKQMSASSLFTTIPQFHKKCRARSYFQLVGREVPSRNLQAVTSLVYIDQ